MDLLDEILIEGGHIARGELARLCATAAFPSARIHMLYWSEGGALAPIAPRCTVHAVRLADYYDTFAALLHSQYMLIVPCTQRGIVMANVHRHDGPVLSEPWLTDMNHFDKRFLRGRFPALTEHLTKTTDRWTAPKQPLLAKPLGGHSSAGQILVTSEHEFQRLHSSGNYLFEEWFGDSRAHYSCSLFKGGAWACIERIAQGDGHTTVARRPRNHKALDFCEALKEWVKLDSAINLQFAEVDESFRIYDINPRFGYSELFRTCWGTNFVAAYFGLSSPSLTDEPELTSEDAWSLLRSSAIATSISS